MDELAIAVCSRTIFSEWIRLLFGITLEIEHVARARVDVLDVFVATIDQAVGGERGSVT